MAHGVNSSVFNVSYGPVDVLANPGSADVWALKHGGFDQAFTIKLPDDGEYGYLLPANMIKPTADEYVASLVAVLFLIS
ncbi:Oidioi.mRNA.OKI2018_I69.PAR.g11528.t1.cds [Oikopleura dioica]|uniref:Oidioi.mRNA.OKI2018_I69.PAR.g11528.t1.cds n=1 Tax=Oikopleura dioica TaxID=34765 RepID=A0ABN7RW66_OIKDI|nr:Oidioi.mRNA.OKI2018_I69.PAR.g11528.t1.cds [Oikopleura dioica]